MNKSWYAVITADVLYNKNLNSRQKILFSVIGNLSNEKGFCFANNKYLSEIMDCSTRTLQRDIDVLMDLGFINRVIKLNKKGQVDLRLLTPMTRVTPPHDTGVATPHDTGVAYNNKQYNNKINKLSNIPQNQKNDFKADLDINEIEVLNPFQISILDQIKEKEKSSAKKEKEFDIEVLNCYRVCLDYFPNHLHPKNPKTWYQVIDKLNRIDGYSFQDIELVVKSVRNDDFWSRNFLSMTKLRRKNKDDVMYFTVFVEKFKQKEQTINRQTKQTIESNLKGW